MMILGKCFEGCTREHCTIPDACAKTVTDKLRSQIRNTIQGQGNDRRQGQINMR